MVERRVEHGGNTGTPWAEEGGGEGYGKWEVVVEKLWWGGEGGGSDSMGRGCEGWVWDVDGSVVRLRVSTVQGR